MCMQKHIAVYLWVCDLHFSITKLVILGNILLSCSKKSNVYIKNNLLYHFLYFLSFSMLVSTLFFDPYSFRKSNSKIIWLSRIYSNVIDNNCSIKLNEFLTIMLRTITCIIFFISWPFEWWSDRYLWTNIHFVNPSAKLYQYHKIWCIYSDAINNDCYVTLNKFQTFT